MKKITYLTISFFLLIGINACAGYKPILGTSNLQFKISDYSIKVTKAWGEKFTLSYIIYHNLTKKIQQ